MHTIILLQDRWFTSSNYDLITLHRYEGKVESCLLQEMILKTLETLYLSPFFWCRNRALDRAGWPSRWEGAIVPASEAVAALEGVPNGVTRCGTRERDGLAGLDALADLLDLNLV